MKAGDEALLKTDLDFVGLQHYTREVVAHSTIMPYLNARIVKATKRDVPLTTMNWEIYPEGLYRILKRFYSYEGIRKIIITENGAAFPDRVEKGHVYDYDRILFYQQYLEQVLRAKREGVNVEGYFAWSFSDNLEWAEGDKQRFGLVYIDYPTQRRIIKSSGFWFQEFLQKQQQFSKAV